MSRHILTVCIVTFIVVVFVTTSYIQNNWLYFSRSGALIVAIGVFIEYWPILKEPHHDKLPFWSSSDSHKAARVSAVCVIIGTLIWGYGDLFCHAFKQCN